MIVRTSQDATQINCGCCDMPACEEPRKLCESITVEACGYTLPDHPSVPAEDRCKKYSKNIVSQVEILNVSGYKFTNTITGDIFIHNETQTYSLSCEHTYNYREIDGVRSCIDRQESTSMSIEDSYSETKNDEPFLTGSVSGSSSSGIDGDGCSGSITYTSQYVGDEETSETDPISVCECFDPSPAGDASYSDGIFSRTSTSTVTGPEGGTQTTTTTTTHTYSDQVTISTLSDELDIRVAAIGSGPWPDSACNSEVINSYGHADPPDPEANPLPETPIVCTQVDSVTKARYKIGIPNSDGYANYEAAHAAWVTAHATWVSADPDTRGPEPIEPVQRSVFQCQWDEVFFPEEWSAWKVLKDAFDAATIAYNTWESCNANPPSGGCGVAPTIPDNPGAAPSPAPSLVASRSWSYSGSSEFSEWFDIAIPSSSGETRVVNMMVKCFASSRLGLKPTAHGEIYEV